VARVRGGDPASDRQHSRPGEPLDIRCRRNAATPSSCVSFGENGPSAEQNSTLFSFRRSRNIPCFKL